MNLLLGNLARGIPPASGAAAAVIANARAEAQEEISDHAARAQAFDAEVIAYKAAPQLYERRKVLELYSDLGTVRKYLFVGDRSDVVIQYDTAEQGGLDRVLQEGVQKERAKLNP
jgi:hypothetical protein